MSAVGVRLSAADGRADETDVRMLERAVPSNKYVAAAAAAVGVSAAAAAAHRQPVDDFIDGDTTILPPQLGPTRIPLSLYFSVAPYFSSAT